MVKVIFSCEKNMLLLSLHIDHGGLEPFFVTTY